MIVTSVEKIKGNNQRLSVYIDHRYAFSITEEDYLSLNLYETREISEEEVEYIRNTVNFRAAKSTAIRYLSMKLRCEQEVARKLQQDAYDPETSIRVIEELKAMGYLNDRMYAHKYVYDRLKLKPKSRKLLKLELSARGVTSDIVEEVVNELEMDEELVAEGLVRKRFGKYDLDDEKILKRVYSFLTHRGYGFNLIQEVVNKVKAGGDL